jgi:hypothetical protein
MVALLNRWRNIAAALVIGELPVFQLGVTWADIVSETLQLAAASRLSVIIDKSCSLLSLEKVRRLSLY